MSEKRPLDCALESYKHLPVACAAATDVTNALELCAKIYQQVSGQDARVTDWDAEEMANILAIYDRFQTQVQRAIDPFRRR